MLLLAGPTALLRLVTSAAMAVDVHVSYIENNAGAITPLTQNTAISTATTTTILGSPASGVQRNAKGVQIRNKGASPDDVTVQHNDGTTTVELMKTTLQAGEELEYNENTGWIQHLASGAVKTGFDPAAAALTGGTMSGVDITTKAGAAGAAGFHMPTGVLKTAPLAGDLEYDGLVPYFSPVASERGVIHSEQFISTQGGTFTLASQTAAQKMFGTPTNGALTVGGTRTYLFECQFDLSSMSATSGAFGFALLGTATYTYLKWWSDAIKAALATAGAVQSTMNANTTANTAICSATTNTVGWGRVYGILRVNAGGTIIPAISLGIAAAAVVGRDSFFRIWPWGNSTVGNVGNWS